MDFHFNGRYINYLSFELELKFLFLIQEPSGVKKKKLNKKILPCHTCAVSTSDCASGFLDKNPCCVWDMPDILGWCDLGHEKAERAVITDGVIQHLL